MTPANSISGAYLAKLYYCIQFKKKLESIYLNKKYYIPLIKLVSHLHYYEYTAQHIDFFY